MAKNAVLKHLGIKLKDLIDEKVDNFATQFEDPIDSYMKDIGTWRTTPVIGDEKIGEPTKKSLTDLKKFKKIYFSQISDQEYEPWVYFGRTEDGIFVFFEASCDYTGFDCRGGGTVIYATTYHKLWKFGLTDAIRDKIKKRSHITEEDVISMAKESEKKRFNGEHEDDDFFQKGESDDEEVSGPEEYAYTEKMSKKIHEEFLVSNPESILTSDGDESDEDTDDDESHPDLRDTCVIS